MRDGFIKPNIIGLTYTNESIFSALRNYTVLKTVDRESYDTGTYQKLTGYANISNGEAKDNAMHIMNVLITRLGIEPYQAAAIAAICMKESGCNPAAYNKGEAPGGKNTSSSAHWSKAGAFAYGAGLIQWTFVPRKNKVLASIGKGRLEDGVRIEKCTLDEQIEMIANELESPEYKRILAGLKNSQDTDIATATLYCHYVGGYKNTDRPATLNEAYAMAARYMKANPGSTEEAHFIGRARYARTFYEEYMNNI